MMAKRKVYTAEFKREAVKLLTEQNMGITDAARQLGVHVTLLRYWKKQLAAEGDQAFPGKGRLKPAEEELQRLREENRQLRMTNEILKKATAFFAKESL
jgi:transposase